MAGVIPRTITTTTSWNVLLIPSKTRTAEPGCTVCHQPLDLHQPDVEQPDRLLATCGNCGAWHLLQQPDHGKKSLLARLPDFPELLLQETSSTIRRPRVKSG